MPLIQQERTTFTYTGPPLDLDSAEWLWYVYRIYRFVEGSFNSVGYVPGSSLNTFHTLETGQGYIVDTISGAPDFQIPDGIQFPDMGAADGASATIAGLRALQQIPINSRFHVTDPGKEGDWWLHPTDTTTPDNGGTCVVNLAGQRIKRIFVSQQLASWYDILPGDESLALSNSLKLDALLKRDKQIALYFPRNANGTDHNYYLAPVPDSSAFKDSPLEVAAITLIDSYATLEQQEGVRAQVTEQNCIGMQSYRLLGSCRPTFLNWTIYGKGGYQSDYQAIGYYNYVTQEFTTTAPADFGSNPAWKREYSQNWGGYKYNGYNMWSPCIAKGLYIGGFVGHGICNFGATDVRITGPSTSFGATASVRGGMTYLVLDDPNQGDLFPGGDGGTAKLDLPNYVAERTGFAYDLTDGSVEVPLGTTQPYHPQDGQHVTGIVYAQGNNLFADGARLEDVDCSGCGGAGLFTVGNEANTNTFTNLSVNLNGAWGAIDSSLLGNSFPYLKTATNGQHFNSYEAPGGPYLRVGGFSNNGGNARSILVNPYHEEDQGRSQLGVSTIVLGGVEGFGYDGGYGIGEGGKMRGLFSGSFTALPHRIDYGTFGQLWDNASTGIHNQYFHEPSGEGFRIRSGSLVHQEYAVRGRLADRDLDQPFIALNGLLISDRRHERVKNLQALLDAPDAVYLEGDTFPVEHTQAGYKELRCIASGSNKHLPAGTTMQQFGNTMLLSSPITTLQVGDYFEVQGDVPYPGNYFHIWSTTPTETAQGKYDIGGAINIYLTPVTNVSAPVDYAKARWQAVGDGMGTTAQRPDMTGIEGPWRYFNKSVNNGTWQTWTGTGFVNS
jgi:hypothetical protein